MKKYFSGSMLAAALLISSVAAAETDWSPVLCGIVKPCTKKDGNWNPWDYKALPAKYKASVAKKTGKEDDGYAMNYTLFLKDASAFGFPLKKINIEGSGGYQSFTLYFANGDFVSLKPQIERMQRQNSKNSLASECGEASWNINPRNNTLSFGEGC